MRVLWVVDFGAAKGEDVEGVAGGAEAGQGAGCEPGGSPYRGKSQAGDQAMRDLVL